MEIKYKRTYTPALGKLYTAGEITAMFGYALEVADPRVKLKEGKLEPGEVCMLLFGITPEEYALREGESKKLDALAETLRKQVPADRLIGWRICDLKGAPVQRVVKLETCETMDGGAFAAALKEKRSKVEIGPLDMELIACARTQREGMAKDAPEEKKAAWLDARRALGAKLAGVERLFVADDAATNGRFPSIGFDNHIELFTLEGRAQRALERVHQSVGVKIWQLRELKGAEIAAYLRRCAGDGLNLLRIDNGFAAAELQIADVLQVPASENAAMRSFMLREIEYGLRWRSLKEINAPEPNQRGALESMITMRNFIWNSVANGALYVLCVGEGDANCIAVSDKPGNPRMLALFTDAMRAAAFGEQTQGNVRPVKLAFDELVKRAANCEGFVIDVGAINYRIPKTEFEKLADMKGKLPQLVRIQPPKPAEPTVKPEASMGELPDPDRFAPVQKKEEAAEEPKPVEAEAPQTGDEPPKKGFFKRFFGK